MCFDDIKYTIMYMLNKNGYIVTDTPIDFDKKMPLNIEFPNILFKSYDEDYTKINIIDYDYYNKYGEEKIPNFDIDIINNYLILDNIKVRIIDYDKEFGTITTDKVLSKTLFPYNDMLYISVDDEEIKKNEDVIFLSSSYSYMVNKNINVIEYYRRFNFNVFIFDDIGDNKAIEYMKSLYSIFERDFPLLDKNYEMTKKYGYIANPLTFDITETNITNKILRGSILIRTYKEKGGKHGNC